jgi:hypothetical protein
MFGSFLPGLWLVGTTKVYSGIGADIVMESITLVSLGDEPLGNCEHRIDEPFTIKHVSPWTSKRFTDVLQPGMSVLTSSSALRRFVGF